MKNVYQKHGLNFVGSALLLFFSFGSLAQSDSIQVDSSKSMQGKFETPEQLADTVWWILQQKNSKVLVELIPNMEVIQSSLDSFQIKTNPQAVKIKYNTILVRVTKQLKFLTAKAKINKLNFKTCEKKNLKIEQGLDDKGHKFAYITIACQKNKREFAIKFVALNLNHYWYLVDELALEFPEDDPYYKVPKKLKKGK